MDARKIASLQTGWVAQWHDHPESLAVSLQDHELGSDGRIAAADENDADGFQECVRRQHVMNFQLWHQEDDARDPQADDTTIARVKRVIDSLNQRRNDEIEKLDEWISRWLSKSGKPARDDASINTETPGSAIDRLSIMSLRLYHYQEQIVRSSVDDEHRGRTQQRIEICRVQYARLIQSLQELLDDLLAGRKRHVVYRQMKMYNDPTLNPKIYGATK